MKHFKPRILSILLALVLIITVLPLDSLTVHAANPENFITTLTCWLEIPVAGDASAGPGTPAPAYVTLENNPGFKLDSAYWYASNGLAPEVFEAGQPYFAELWFTANDGRKFNENTYITLSGATVKKKEISEDGKQMYICTNSVTISDSPKKDVTVSIV